MMHLFESSMYSEKKTMKLRLSLMKGLRGDHFRINTCLSSIPPGPEWQSLRHKQNIQSSFYKLRSTVCDVRICLFFFSCSCLWLGSKLQDLQRVSNHQSEFILKRFFILIFSFSYSPKILINFNLKFTVLKS